MMKKKLLSGILAGVLFAAALPGMSYAAETETVDETETAAEAETETASELAAGMETGTETEAETDTGASADSTGNTWYEVFVYSFWDSDGDGIGDLNGVYDKLDYINDGDDSTDTDLGCDGIWLMPVMPSTTYHKYDVTDYMDIDSQYGTMDDFKKLVEECHNRGIRVIIDLPMNHTSSEHPWFKQAAEYLAGLSEGEEPDASVCPYVDYYNFSRETESGYNPLDGTDWYYESRFWSGMPDLNLGNEAVRAEFEKIVDFWLDAGVDGFRLDAVKEYYTGDTEKNVEVLSWFNEMVKGKKPDAYLVAEVWTDLNTYAQYYASGIDSLFDFDFSGQDGIIASTVKQTGSYNASSYGKTLVNLQETIAKYTDSGADAPFYTNHDMARGAGYYPGEIGEQQTKMAQALNLTMSGNAFLYYGEELGMKGSGKDENFRAPMYWSEDSDAEGMCAGPEAMDAIKMKYGSLEEQENDETSIYQYVKDVIALRNKYPAIASGTVEFLENLSGENVCVLRKTAGDSEVLLLYNISDSTETVSLDGVTVNGSDAAGKDPSDVLLTGEEAVTVSDGTVTMPAYSVAVFE